VILIEVEPAIKAIQSSLFNTLEGHPGKVCVVFKVPKVAANPSSPKAQSGKAQAQPAAGTLGGDKGSQF
jgi:hypothetical protein